MVKGYSLVVVRRTRNVRTVLNPNMMLQCNLHVMMWMSLVCSWTVLLGFPPPPSYSVVKSCASRNKCPKDAVQSEGAASETAYTRCASLYHRTKHLLVMRSS